MRKAKVFIAGSTTEVAKERTVIYSAIAEWNSTKSLANKQFIEFQPYSYINFSDTIDPVDGNTKYNIFIKNECDLIVFILAGTIGDKTLMEFNVAYDSLHGERHAPVILVFNKSGIEVSENLNIIKLKLTQDGKYWINYDNLDYLSLLLKEELTKFEPLIKERFISARKRSAKRLAIVLLSLLLLVLSFTGIHYYHSSLVKRVQQDISYIRSNPGLSGKLRKIQTIEFLENHSFPQKDSLLTIVKSL